MPGRFKNAPLVYVTAKITTSSLPTLTLDQKAALEQAMIKRGLVLIMSSQGKEVNLAHLANMPPETSSADLSQLVRSVTRQAFMSADKHECLVIDEAGSIEYRVSRYNKYSDFIERFEGLLRAMVEAVEAVGFIQSQEFVLSYADLIIPLGDRVLADYFRQKESVLPLNILSPTENDERRLGQVQVTRVTKPTEKISINLEQLPIVEGRVTRLLPQVLVEPEQRFAMPLFPAYSLQGIESKDYGLLMTQAAMIGNHLLSELNIKKNFDCLHNLTKETFWDLLNESVCKKDWEYIEE